MGADRIMSSTDQVLINQPDYIELFDEPLIK